MPDGEGRLSRGIHPGFLPAAAHQTKVFNAAATQRDAKRAKALMADRIHLTPWSARPWPRAQARITVVDVGEAAEDARTRCANRDRAYAAPLKPSPRTSAAVALASSLPSESRPAATPARSVSLRFWLIFHFACTASTATSMPTIARSICAM